MRTPIKIIVASVSMLAVGAVMWRVSSRSPDPAPRTVVTPAAESRAAALADEDMSEVDRDPDEAVEGGTAITEQDKLNLADPKRPRSAPTVRRRKIEKSLEAFQSADASQRFRTAGQVLCEAITVIMDSEGRWEPAQPAASTGGDGKAEAASEPAEGESIVTLDGRTYTISLAEFPEFDECTASERKRLQGEQRSGPPVMTEELAASVEARVQQALAVLQHFERNR